MNYCMFILKQKTKLNNPEKYSNKEIISAATLHLVGNGGPFFVLPGAKI